MSLRRYENPWDLIHLNRILLLIIFQSVSLILALQMFASSKPPYIQVRCNNVFGRFFSQINVDINHLIVDVLIVPLSLPIQLYWLGLNIHWRPFWILWTWSLQLVSTRRWRDLMYRLFAELLLLNFSDLIYWHYWVFLWSSITWWYYFWSPTFNILALLDCSWWFTVNRWGLKIIGVYFWLNPFVRNNWMLYSFCKILLELVSWVYFTPFLFC